MSALAVIPARGGSQGIPRKNLLEVGGRPLIAWTIAQALAAREQHPELNVAVSTEDAEIEDVAREHGATVIDRPAELAGHTAATEPAVLLQATSPVRRTDTIARALTLFRGSEVDALVGIVPESPFFWRPPVEEGGSAGPAYDVPPGPAARSCAPSSSTTSGTAASTSPRRASTGRRATASAAASVCSCWRRPRAWTSTRWPTSPSPRAC